MRTENDLQAAFAVLEENAPTECLAPVDEPHPRRRRRSLPLIAAVATVVVVAIGVPLLVSGTTNGPRPAQSSQQTPVPPPAIPEQAVPLQYTFTTGHVPGYTFTLAGIRTGTNNGMQIAQITIGSGSNDNNGAPGALYVFAPGRFDPGLISVGRHVTVNGHPGYFATIPSPTLRDDQGDPAKLSALAWRYAADSWAMVQVDFRQLEALRGMSVDALAEELKLARVVHTDQSQPLLVPFRFGYLPTGLVTEGASPEQGGMWVYLGDGRPRDPHNTDWGSALSVWFYPASDPNGIFCQGARTFTVDGRGGCFVSQDRKGGPTGTFYLNVKGGLIEMLVDGNHLGIYSDDVLKQIATSMVLADLHNPGAWFDGTTVLPR